MTGVQFQHYGRTIRVRGGELVKHLGRELWALVDRRDASMVTFMNLDFSEPFTMEVCAKPSACESATDPDSGLLASERSKIREHEKVVDTEYKNLLANHGNPRRDLLAAIRNQPPAAGAAIPGRPVRRVVIDPQMTASAAQMEAQRESIRTEKTVEKTHRRRVARVKQDTGIALSQAGAKNLDSETYRHLRELSAWDELPDDTTPPAAAAQKETL